MDRPPRILIIDDDRDLITLLATLLKRINVESVAARDGIEGLGVLKSSQRPDMIILDLMLPDMDGLEVLQRIRAQPELSNVPVVILSATGDPDTIRFSLDRGADEYITKPYTPDELLTRVKMLLQSRHGGQRVEHDTD